MGTMAFARKRLIICRIRWGWFPKLKKKKKSLKGFFFLFVSVVSAHSYHFTGYAPPVAQSVRTFIRRLRTGHQKKHWNRRQKFKAPAGFLLALIVCVELADLKWHISLQMGQLSVSMAWLLKNARNWVPCSPPPPHGPQQQTLTTTGENNFGLRAPLTNENLGWVRVQ